jgi:two-component system, chemotaxis family, response regulator PixG
MHKITLSPLSGSRVREDRHATSSGDASGSSVLLISASPATCATVNSYFRRKGFAVKICASEVAALRWLVSPQARPLDLVLLDIDLPGMNSYGMLRFLRARPASAQANVFVLSRFDGVMERLLCRLAGASGYLVKPISPSVLLHTMAAHLSTVPRMRKLHWLRLSATSRNV